MLAEADGLPVLGCDTEVLPRGRVYTPSESTIPLAEFGAFLFDRTSAHPPSGAPGSSCVRKFRSIIAPPRVSCLCPDATDLDKSPCR